VRREERQHQPACPESAEVVVALHQQGRRARTARRDCRRDTRGAAADDQHISCFDDRDVPRRFGDCADGIEGWRADIGVRIGEAADCGSGENRQGGHERASAHGWLLWEGMAVGCFSQYICGERGFSKQ